MAMIVPLFAFILASIFGLVVYVFGDKLLFRGFYYSFILNQLPVFTVGMTYFFVEKRGTLSIPDKTGVILSLILMCSSFLTMYLLVNNISISIFLASLSFCCLFSYFKNKNFNLPLLTRIGQLSFSIYLFHFLFAWPLSSGIAHFLSGKANPHLVYFICFATTMFLAFILAYLSEKIIEKPGINAGKNLIKKLSSKKVIA